MLVYQISSEIEASYQIKWKFVNWMVKYLTLCERESNEMSYYQFQGSDRQDLYSWKFNIVSFE